MNQKLLFQAILKFFAGFLLIGVLLFIPAGTLHFRNAWIFMGVLFIPMLIMGIILMIKNPALLEKRLNSKEQESEQKKVVQFSGLMFLIGFLIAGLDYRFQWLMLPDWLIIISAVIFLMGYAMYAEVLRENTYLSRIVEVQEHQKVIDTGLYGIVRHPMYSATILMFLSMPLILGSVFSFLIFLSYPVIIIRRIRNEEKILEEGLSGYIEYQKKVKYRLLPFIW